MFAIGVGYPLGMNEDKYLIEINRQIYQMPLEELLVWLNVEKTIMENKINSQFTHLVEIGLIIVGESKQEVCEKLFQHKPYRQGAASIENGKQVLFIGDKMFPVTKMQHEIWKCANALTSVEDIYNYVARNRGTEEKVFVDELWALIENGCVFLV